MTVPPGTALSAAALAFSAAEPVSTFSSLRTAAGPPGNGPLGGLVGEAVPAPLLEPLLDALGVGLPLAAKAPAAPASAPPATTPAVTSATVLPRRGLGWGCGSSSESRSVLHRSFMSPPRSQSAQVATPAKTLAGVPVGGLAPAWAAPVESRPQAALRACKVNASA